MKYLLLGFVLMISGLEIAAQDGYHALVCIDGERSERSFETVGPDNAEWLEFYIESNQHENFQVLIQQDGVTVDGWMLGDCDVYPITYEENFEADIEFEQEILPIIRTAGLRGVMGSLFRGE
jgi:hypothetical protein